MSRRITALGRPYGALTVAFLATTALTTLVSVPTVRAQEAATTEKQAFDIPGGALSTALTRFSRATGIEFVAPQDVLAGKTTEGLDGRFGVDAALDRLLAGTGLLYERRDGAIRLIMAQNDASGSDGMQMDPIRISGDAPSGIGPIDGYVPKRTTTGTKTDTPITEVPQSVSVISREAIEDQGATSVEESLQYVPGVIAQPFGRDIRFNQFNVRGFSGTTSATYSDGLQMGADVFTVPRLEPYGQERVEVLRGPSSVLFGDGSPGGVVNLVSKRAPDAFLAEAGVEYGNNDWKQGKFDIGGPLSDAPGISARLTGLVRDAETIVDFSKDDKVFVAPTVRFDFTENTRLEILASYQQEEQFSFGALPIQGTLNNNPNGEIDRDFFVGDPNFDDFETERASIGYEFEHRFNDMLKIQQNARYANVTNEQAVLFGSVSGLQANQRTLNRSSFTVDDELDAWNLDTQAHVDVSLGQTDHKLLAGVDYQRRVADNTRGFGGAPSIDIFNPTYGVQVADPPTFLSDKTTQNQVGFYLQDQIRAFENIILTLSVRHDLVDEETDNRLTNTTTDSDDSATTYRAGLGYAFDNGVTPYVSYSESFEPLVGTDANGDPFDPTTAQQYEVGVKYAPVGYDALLTASAYQLTEQNIQSTSPSNPNLTIQGGEIRSRGIELSAQADLMDSLNVTASYTYTDAEATEGTNLLPEGNTPTVTPEHAAKGWTNYTVPSGTLKGLELGGGVRFVGKTEGDNANTITNPSYTVADARISYTWRDFEAGLHANNLFDNDYIVCNGGATACSFGTARRVRASLTYRW